MKDDKQTQWSSRPPSPVWSSGGEILPFCVAVASDGLRLGGGDPVDQRSAAKNKTLYLDVRSSRRAGDESTIGGIAYRIGINQGAKIQAGKGGQVQFDWTYPQVAAVDVSDAVDVADCLLISHSSSDYLIPYDGGDAPETGGSDDTSAEGIYEDIIGWFKPIQQMRAPKADENIAYWLVQKIDYPSFIGVTLTTSFKDERAIAKMSWATAAGVVGGVDDWTRPGRVQKITFVNLFGRLGTDVPVRLVMQHGKIIMTSAGC